MTSEMCTILVVGGTGYIGKHVVRESVKQGHPTFVYTRPISPQTCPSKLLLLQEFLAKGLTVIHGQLDEHEKLVEAVSKADVVISTLAFPQILDQLKIIEAMKIAGNVKRFIPSEFGIEEDRITTLKPFQQYLERKQSVRRAIEASGISYTIVAANCFAQYFLHVLFHTYAKQADTIIYGTGETKAMPHPENIRFAIMFSVFISGDTANYKLNENDLEASKLYPDANYSSIDKVLEGFLADTPAFRVAAF